MWKERFLIQRNSKLKSRGDEPFQVLARINDNAYKLDLPTTYGEDFDSRTNPFEEGENDRDPTNKVKDNLRDIGGPMTRPKTQIMKQSLPGLSLGITESLKQSESEVAVRVKFLFLPAFKTVPSKIVSKKLFEGKEIDVMGYWWDPYA
ncbi:hypothetical protein CR513_33387, partial [Mucuna pruriens]